MNRTEFFKKLLPFFTISEISRLEKDAFKSFADAHERRPQNSNDKSEAYNFECETIYNYSGSPGEFNSVFSSAIGTEYTQERFDRLTRQLDMEW